MAAIAGIWNHAAGAVSPLANAKPMDTTQGASGSSAGDASTISANDFLTLLVTEMKNQDPTANTDPNEYINQLVQVNSLEQLISINQTLSSDLGGSASGGVQSGPIANAAGAAHSPSSNLSMPGAQPAAASRLLSPGSPGLEPAVTPGNLAKPQATSAADRIAHALTSH